MTHKLKTEMFSQKTEHSGGVILLPLTPLFSFVTFHLNIIFFTSYVTLNLLSSKFCSQTINILLVTEYCGS